MGVINLGLLVDKIKRKLLTAGFITSSDKASKSAFGVVKIGDNISVSSGKISVPLGTSGAPGVLQVGAGLSVTDGVVSATSSGGMTMDELYSGSVTLGADTPHTLAHEYTGYKFLSLVTTSGANTTSGGFMAVANLSTAQYNSNGTGNSTVSSIRLDSSDATQFYTPTGSGVVNIKIYGIK